MKQKYFNRKTFLRSAKAILLFSLIFVASCKEGEINQKIKYANQLQSTLRREKRTTWSENFKASLRSSLNMAEESLNLPPLSLSSNIQLYPEASSSNSTQQTAPLSHLDELEAGTSSEYEDGAGGPSFNFDPSIDTMAQFFSDRINRRIQEAIKETLESCALDDESHENLDERDGLTFHFGNEFDSAVEGVVLEILKLEIEKLVEEIKENSITAAASGTRGTNRDKNSNQAGRSDGQQNVSEEGEIVKLVSNREIREALEEIKCNLNQKIRKSLCDITINSERGFRERISNESKNIVKEVLAKKEIPFGILKIDLELEKLITRELQLRGLNNGGIIEIILTKVEEKIKSIIHQNPLIDIPGGEIEHLEGAPSCNLEEEFILPCSPQFLKDKEKPIVVQISTTYIPTFEDQVTVNSETSSREENKREREKQGAVSLYNSLIASGKSHEEALKEACYIRYKKAKEEALAKGESPYNVRLAGQRGRDRAKAGIMNEYKKRQGLSNKRQRTQEQQESEKPQPSTGENPSNEDCPYELEFVPEDDPIDGDEDQDNL